MAMEITYLPIGVLHTPFTALSEMPIQPTSAASAPGTAEISREFADGLKDLDGFSHVILIYHLHHVSRVDLRVLPFLDSEPHGVFATRAPTRPNPIGLSIVRLMRVEGCTLYLGNMDILDGTPLLDIKPYVPAFDKPARARAGWLQESQKIVRSRRADNRFQ
jgi:tRNA-Thr(GGU) m(6)t(6)A37 methyltransferase TsaA